MVAWGWSLPGMGTAVGTVCWAARMSSLCGAPVGWKQSELTLSSVSEPVLLAQWHVTGSSRVCPSHLSETHRKVASRKPQQGAGAGASGCPVQPHHPRAQSPSPVKILLYIHTVDSGKGWSAGNSGNLTTLG